MIKLMIIGHAESGKDDAASFIRKKLGLTFESSSLFCVKKFLFIKAIRDFGPDRFKTPEELYEARRFDDKLRVWMYDSICDINKEDPTTLAAAIFDKYEIYVGIRSYHELEACKKKWPELLVLYLDADGRVPKEPEESCTVTKEQAHIIIENKNSLEEFEDKLERLCNFVGNYKEH